MSNHIVLLGDSIFDNGAYVPGGPSVLEHVRRFLPDGWRATLLALDGATVSSVFRQLERVPNDATHFVLSVGGNNALWLSGDLLSETTSDVRASLKRVSELLTEFRSEYRQLVIELRELKRPLTICTIYDSIPGLEPSEVAGLCFFNDFITRTAFEFELTLIDLRTLCNEAADYSPLSPIEPSAGGGGKIARAIVSAVLGGGKERRVIA